MDIPANVAAHTVKAQAAQIGSRPSALSKKTRLGSYHRIGANHNCISILIKLLLLLFLLPFFLSTLRKFKLGNLMIAAVIRRTGICGFLRAA